MLPFFVQGLILNITEAFMFSVHIGEFAALFTACCWTVTALAFESASNKVGSIAVNLLRLALALVFLSIFCYITRGRFFPSDAGEESWLWLSLSGLIGFVIGDLFLFESYTIIGSRVAMLIMTLVPPMTAFLSWLMLGETMTLFNFLGMALTLGGIAVVIVNKGTGDTMFSVTHSLRGILFAFIGAVGQAVGLVFSKVGMGDYNAFAATQIRIITGIIGFVIVITIWKKWRNVGNAVKNVSAIKRIGLGSVFGPFLGVSFSLFAVQHANAGIASTIMAIVPVLIIPASVIFMHQKVTLKEIIGAVISVCGVALFFL
ncbi:MAG TPA: DMT family transporter [Bacteroidales bacterium]|nr:DMT family transporter [Bacteroidales bacterium]